MGKKYIVEVNHGERLYRARVGEDGVPSLSYIGSTESLTPYTAPDLEQVRKEAYEKGLSDVWECVDRIFDMPCKRREQIFSKCNTVGVWDILHAYSAAEAIEKLKQYEREQNKIIKVGDIVRFKSTPEIEIWVTDISDEDGGRLSGLALKSVRDNCEIGDTYAYREIHQFERTGRHCDVAAVLEKMRGEQDG